MDCRYSHADLSKKFDEWGTQFVAVTQEINTATSAGRMMLNILIMELPRKKAKQ